MAGLPAVSAGPLREGRVSKPLSFSVPLLATIEAGFCAIAITIFLLATLLHLSKHPAITSDEMWILSSSHKLASTGVFGSDLFRGFYGADQHYFFNMPGHHVAIAASLKLFGAGI